MHASRARNVPRSRSYQALIRLSPRVSTDETRGYLLSSTAETRKRMKTRRKMILLCCIIHIIIACFVLFKPESPAPEPTLLRST